MWKGSFNVRFKTILAAFVVLFGLSQPALAASCSEPAGASGLKDMAGKLLERERGQAGGRRISRNARLDRAAQVQACYIAKNGYMPSAPHTGARGSTPMVRIRAAGYRACLSAENLAVNFPTAEGVVNEWMHSPKHRANITLEGVRDYGLGLAMLGTRPVWIMVIAKRC